MEYVAHESAIIDEGAEIGRGTRIWHWSHIMRARIGRDVTIGQGVFVGDNAVVGDGTKIQNGASVFDGVKLGEYVFVGPSATFTNDLTPRARHPKGGVYVPTVVEHDASIGANATILCGVTIGAFAMIGAGATVTRDVPERTIVVGVDRHVGLACDCGSTIQARACPSCGRTY